MFNRAIISLSFVRDYVFSVSELRVWTDSEWISEEFVQSNKLAHQMKRFQNPFSIRLAYQSEEEPLRGKAGSDEKKKPICVAPLCSYAALCSNSQGQSPENRRHASVKLKVDLTHRRNCFVSSIAD